MRVFLDANIIINAMATRGLCADVLREVLGRHQLVISEILLDEINRVLQDKICVPPNIVADVIALLRDGAVMAIPVPSAELPIPNSVDRALISAAINGKADLFVTGDGELFALSEAGPINIISPRMFWERAKEKR
jgi:putative PIN family toxin of toxin-antitoxin system